MKLTADRVVTWSQADVPAGIELSKVYLGPDPHGLGGFQVAVGTASVSPARSALRDLFATRKGKTQIQLVIAVVYDGKACLFGPDPQSKPIELPADQALRQLQSVLAEPDVVAATERFAGFRKANDSTGVSGFANSGLFASHHITTNVPKRTDWEALGDKAAPLLSKRGKQLVEALGFGTQAGPNGTMLLSIGAHPPRAVAVLLEESEQFDAKTQRFQLSPVAFGLAVASRQDVPWLVVLRKDQIRLYPGRDGVGVGSKGQAETYFEIDLATIDAEFAALLPLVFSADALAADGTADELLRDSARYATELGARLRERIYDEIVPPLAVEVAQRLAKDAKVSLDAEGLALAYRVTLRILFRLLFQAYAEDRGLLPSGRNPGFDANSLKTNAQRLLDSDSDTFGDSSTIWFDLVQVWNAVDRGNPQWQIPSYNGGLFSTDPERSPEGALIKKIELPDGVLGPALKSLLIDVTGDGVLGPVDFRSLSVREFGTIYEGLLESSLSLAEDDLTIDSSGAWVPAKKNDEVYAPSGSVYFHTASGERKATGSYFTPKVVVDHLVERSIVPALGTHLEKIAAHLGAGDASAAAREFFDFRVADLAMGSGHFLVAAVDKIEALMRTFLTEHAVPGVNEELVRLASAARDALGTDDVAKSDVDEVGLLRRQVARRCIYGLDINPMAVELARLALWIHTFVPGLPMSNLDHGLVNANSLTGIGTIDEALDALQPGRRPGEIGLFDEILTDQLASAKTLLIDVANASEANKAEVEQGARLLAEAKAAADTARQIFNAAVAVRVGRIRPDAVLDRDSIFAVLERSELAEIEAELQPAHMPYLFPEVFLRDDPGFDALIGNPPWEILHVEEDKWWGLRFPGLRGMPKRQRDVVLAKFQEDRPDLVAQYKAEVDETRLINAAIAAGPYPGLGGAHLDMYQAFAWRNWALLRQFRRAGIVLPRIALQGAALAEWRRTVLSDGGFTDVCFATNSGGWLFENVHYSYTAALTVVAKNEGNVAAWAGPFESEAALLGGADSLTIVDADEFLSWSDGRGTFPFISDPTSAEILGTMRRTPRILEPGPGWAFRPVQGDLNTSTDRAALADPSDQDAQTVEVWAGASFNLWDPNFGDPYFTAASSVLRPYLRRKFDVAARNSRSAYFSVRLPPGELPIDRCRIAYRGIARSTDRRTTIACLLPPETAVQHSAPVLVRLEGQPKDEAYLLGILSSVPFDWQARRWIDLNYTFELLGLLAAPRSVDSVLGSRVVEIAGRLAAVDGRYAAWASEVGVPVGSVGSSDQKDDLVAELDSVVALLYGLTEDQVEHVFATFHRGWDYEQRLEAVLRHYRAWKGKE